ncbi:MAG TPA: DinB family protein [Fimbriimonadaceae bacterium]|nr:DinB family protein [Fimbriimonadaceae bacterium]
MDAATVAEALRQILHGEDFDPPTKLRGMKPEVATRVPEGVPYSIATNLWHCDYWNRLWLARLTGAKRPAKNIWAEDWQIPTESEWSETVERFMSNLELAREIALREPLEHAMKSDEVAIKTLNQIAVHTAYHVGQIALLKRILRAEKENN